MMFLYGASGHGKVIADILSSNGIETKAFIDDNPSLSLFSNKAVHHALSETDFDVAIDDLIISVGNNFTRKMLAYSLKVKFGKGVRSSGILSQSS